MKKIALVTGASRGIGKAAALALACDGWTVHVNYIQSQAAAEAVAAQTGGLAIRADVSDAQAVAAMFEQTGPVDLLVNNAGIAVYGLLTDLEPDVWQRLFDVNVTGTYNCCRFAIPPMVHEKAGHIINLTSILGMNGASWRRKARSSRSQRRWQRSSARPASALTASPPAALTPT